MSPAPLDPAPAAPSVLDASLVEQLREYMANLRQPIELVASLDDSEKSKELDILLDQVASTSPHIVRRTGADPRRPSFKIARAGTDVSVGFAGLPMGHEFTSLVLALLQVGGHPPRIDQALANQIRDLEGTFDFETYMSLSCQSCPDTVQALNAISAINSNITHTAIDGALFQDEVERKAVMSVPTVFLNGQPFGQGRMTVEELVARLDEGSAAKAAQALATKAPFDVLVVGAGPAGAAAAIYAARKGIRTGLVSERFGGQVLDTLAIENFVSVKYTEGPRMAVALEEHVREYGVDVMNLQRAVALRPASDPGGLAELELEGGAILRARAIILATGARWRQMGVAGEEQYRNKGVAYCPHCDGPLYKGKRVAVIGGGNSGVEAAIDLAGIAAHVTLVEFDDALRADEILQDKLMGLPNVDTLLATQTTQVVGDGARVSGLAYEDRASGRPGRLGLEGVFVQIGLLPNTDWLADAVHLSDRGEIVVDDRGATSAPGVFAAGDATTVPYKQVVIAMGAGATAALGAFDHLMRN